MTRPAHYSIIILMKKTKDKILLIILGISLIIAIVALVLLCIKSKKNNKGAKTTILADATITKTTEDTSDKTENTSEVLTEEATTEEPTSETKESIVSRDAKYNKMALEAKEKGQKVVYLTFDDGSGALTPTVLDILDQYGVKATFFVVAEYSPSEDFAKEQYNNIISKDHTLGIHSFTHSRANIYQSLDSFKTDVDKIYEFINRLTGYTPFVSRFPGGSATSFADERMSTEYIPYVLSKGLTYYDWNVSSGDGSGSITSDQVYQNVINGVQSKDTSVVLMHDGSGHEATVEALPRILDTLINQMNCVILPITESTTPVQSKK